MTALDWTARSVLDDLREEARTSRLLDSPFAEHPTFCGCRECLRDAYDLGDDRGTTTTATTLAVLIALGLLLLAGGWAVSETTKACHASATTPSAHQFCEDLNR